MTSLTCAVELDVLGLSPSENNYLDAAGGGSILTKLSDIKTLESIQISEKTALSLDLRTQTKPLHRSDSTHLHFSR